MILLAFHMPGVYVSVSCASLGKVVIKEGSPTADRVCGHPTTHKIHSIQAVNRPISQNQVSEISTVLPKLNPTSATADTSNTTTQTLPSSILKPNSTRAVYNSVHTVYQVSQNLDRSLSFETTAPSGVSADFRMTRETSTWSSVICFILFTEYCSHPSLLVLFS